MRTPTLAEHQRSAVRSALEILSRQRGLVLADDVGLGKSFVASAVAADLQRRYRVEVIVPATLVSQWRETLAQFAVAGLVISHASLITSPLIADPILERLLIVDEAHAFRNPKTLRYDALARRSIGARVLLVTATPICNSARDLHALLSLIVADDAVAMAGVPSIDIAFRSDDREAIAIVMRELVIRRQRDVVAETLRFATVKRRVVRFPLVTDEGEIARTIASLRFPLVEGAPLLRRFLWRRLESSEAALLESVRRQLRFYERALQALAAGRPLTKRDYRRLFGHEEDREAWQQLLFWDLWAPSQTAAGDANEVAAEMRRLVALRECIERSPRQKERFLCAVVEQIGDPFLLFTSSAATARSVAAALRHVRRCGVVTARDRRTSEASLAAFVAGTLDALIATDLASEGLNLQNAGVIIHYDLPWNPVRLEQRNGRAARIGQRRGCVDAIYFLPGNDQTSIVRTLAAKNRVRRRILQASAELAPAARSLRARVAGDAAVARLGPTALVLPAAVDRRHKAGVERLIASMAAEYLDAERLAYLRAVLARDAPI